MSASARLRPFTFQRAFSTQASEGDVRGVCHAAIHSALLQSVTRSFENHEGARVEPLQRCAPSV